MPSAPSLDRDRIRREWVTNVERCRWTVPFEGGSVTLHDRGPKMDREKLVLDPELIYRRYEDEQLTDEAVIKIAMRCYYSEERLDLIATQRFRVVAAWADILGNPTARGRS